MNERINFFLKLYLKGHQIMPTLKPMLFMQECIKTILGLQEYLLKKLMHI